MAIPDSAAFSLNDVRIELAGSNPYSLSDAFTASVDGSFDATYKGSKDRLSNFRNYGGYKTALLYGIRVSNDNDGHSTASAACVYFSEVESTLLYFNLSEGVINNGTVVYTTSALSTVFNGQDDWFAWFNSGTSDQFTGIISTLGVVSGKIDCDDSTAPSVPIGLGSVSITTTTFTLSWSASTDASYVAGYKVFKGGGLYSDVGNVITIGITGQTESASNTWTVKAYDALANESAASSGLVVTQLTATTAFDMANNGHATNTTACTLSVNGTKYHDGEGALPIVNDTIYTSASGTVEFNGLDRFWRMGNGTTTIEVNSFGVVQSVGAC